MVLVLILTVNIILLGPCSALVLPTSTMQPGAILSSRPLGVNTSQSLRICSLRGGGNNDDDIMRNSRETRGEVMTSPRPQEAAAPIRIVIGSCLTAVNLFVREIKGLTYHQKILFLFTFAIGFFLGRMRPFWKRYTDINNIPSHMFGPSARSMNGRAITVSDGDTIRFLHRPTWFHPKQLRKGETASSVGLPIRLCTIDAPETPKFGQTGQPFGNEAREHLKSLLDKKNVRIRLLKKDQYGRAVAEVSTGTFLRKYMDELMLKEGLSEVYLGAGASYGNKGKEEYIAIENKARKAKRGIWSTKKRESAAEYKRRTRKQSRISLP